MNERPYPDGVAFDEAWLQRQRAEAMEQSRDAWRLACRYLYQLFQEDGKRGKPVDRIGRADYKRMMGFIFDAETSDMALDNKKASG